MSLFDFLKDKVFGLIANVLLLIIQSTFLISVGNSYETILFICMIWCAITLLWLILSFLKRNYTLKKLLQLQESLDEKYILAEIMEKPVRADDQVYYYLLKKSHKSMLEQIATIKNERKEYREYIEQWIHEIKTPISALKLLCANNKNDFSKNILIELNKIQHMSEQALFYARSECVEKDYHISEHLLSDIIHQAIIDNKPLLINNNVSIELRECQTSVFTDEKWIVFILNQLISNCIKYRKEHLKIHFHIELEDDFVHLHITDNGIGIKEDEVLRIFEKGFTGSNGRVHIHSTGIGLYLCKKLCDKLGVGICAKSSQHGTTIKLSFYKNPYIHYE